MPDTKVRIAPEIQRYVDAIDEQLGGLSPDERSDLLADITLHLEELFSEGTGDELVGSAGTPDEYAAEFCTSVGIGVSARQPSSFKDAALTFTRHIGDHQVTAIIERWLRPLVPAWWGISGLLIGLAIVWPWTGFGLVDPPTWERLAAVGIALAVVVLVANFGNVRRRGRVWQVAAIAIVIMTIISAVHLASTINHQTAAYYYEPPLVERLTDVPPEELIQMWESGLLGDDDIEYLISVGAVNADFSVGP